MTKGGSNRSVGATLMNADSSRSHSIFTIFVETCEKGADGEEHIRAGKLNLVDLAGSERQAKTGAEGMNLTLRTDEIILNFCLLNGPKEQRLLSKSFIQMNTR